MKFLMKLRTGKNRYIMYTLAALLIIVLAFLMQNILTLLPVGNYIGDTNEPANLQSHKAELTWVRLPKITSWQKYGKLYVMGDLYLQMIESDNQNTITWNYPFIGIYVSNNSWGIRRAGFTVYPTLIQHENRKILLTPVALYKQWQNLYTEAIYEQSRTFGSSKGIWVTFILDLANNKRIPNKCYSFKDAWNIHKSKNLILPFSLENNIDCNEFGFDDRR